MTAHAVDVQKQAISPHLVGSQRDMPRRKSWRHVAWARWVVERRSLSPCHKCAYENRSACLAVILSMLHVHAQGSH